MTNRRTRHAIALIALPAIVLTACGGDDEVGSDDRSITLGFPGSVGPTDSPLIAALESLEEDGWTVEFIEFDSPDVQTQALMGGDIDIASMGPATVMAADERGAELVMVGNNNMLDYLIVGAADVATCADLDGRTVAYHSEGSTSTAHLREYLRDTCPDATPEFLVISGSSNRITALVEGQIDGTIVRVEDWISAEVEDDVAHVIDNLAETQSELLTQTIVIDGSKTDDVGPATAALMQAFDTQLAAVNEDPATFAEVAAPILSSSADELAPVIAALVENGTFPQNHELSRDSVQETLAFYEQAGTISGDLTVEQVANFELSTGD